jgi:hypothetical protein
VVAVYGHARQLRHWNVNKMHVSQAHYSPEEIKILSLIDAQGSESVKI